ncbi:MAG: diguanylate cyclase [Rhodospirillaceae bacterium]|nr:diguanylate cyclase [Rhodospirillales bacterium]
MAAPPRLLVVDDDIGTIRLLSSILKDVGEVFFAASGTDAITMVRDQRPDLILLDAEMPGMDGFAVCAAIKSDPNFADLPILFVTAHTDVEIETTALELGAVDFITKPLSPAIVKARVKTHLALKQRTDELLRLASVDGLTGIANRRTFDTSLDHEWRRACRSKSPVSLLMIDVDYFKRFNDHYGHQAGDECLRAIASTLADISQRPGEVVARYGGEEFAVILPACDRATAMKFAEKLRAGVADLHIPHVASDVSTEVTISIGVASLMLDCVTFGTDHPGWTGPCPTVHTCRDGSMTLIAVADRALYEAKRAGRNRVACAAVMDAASSPAPADA